MYDIKDDLISYQNQPIHYHCHLHSHFNLPSNLNHFHHVNYYHRYPGMDYYYSILIHFNIAYSHYFYFYLNLNYFYSHYNLFRDIFVIVALKIVIYGFHLKILLVLLLIFIYLLTIGYLMIVFEVIISQEIISFMRFFLFSFITVIQPVVLRILLLFIILDQFFEGLTQSFLSLAAFAIMFFVVYSWVSVEQSWLVQNFQIKQINY